MVELKTQIKVSQFKVSRGFHDCNGGDAPCDGIVATSVVDTTRVVVLTSVEITGIIALHFEDCSGD